MSASTFVRMAEVGRLRRYAGSSYYTLLQLYISPRREAQQYSTILLRHCHLAPHLLCCSRDPRSHQSSYVTIALEVVC